MVIFPFVFITKIITLFKFAVLRITGWFGSAHFYKKGKAKGKWPFYILAILFWLVLWALTVLLIPSFRHEMARLYLFCRRHIL